jgi:Phage capsid protein
VPEVGSNWYLTAFTNLVTALAQQHESELARGCVEKQVVGDLAYWDRIDPVTMTARTSRIADTPVVDADLTRRQSYIKVYDVGYQESDLNDAMEIVSRPTELTENPVRSVARTKDQIILSAIGGDTTNVVRSFADASETRTTTPLPASQILASGADIVADIREMSYRLSNAGVPMDDRYIHMPPSVEKALLGSVVVTSGDYIRTEDKPVPGGKIISEIFGLPGAALDSGAAGRGRGESLRVEKIRSRSRLSGRYSVPDDAEPHEDGRHGLHRIHSHGERPH